MTRLLRLLAVLLLLLPRAALAGEAPVWTVSLNQGSLTFKGTQMGAGFTGTVAKYTPVVRFDPEHPEHSKVTVDIDVTSIGTGDTDRDKTAATAEWFDFAKFPSARFEADSFKKTGEGAYEASGTLTIKGVSVPVTVPFTFEMVKDSSVPQARVKGSAKLDRSAFGLGTGEWLDPGVIANEVTVDFSLVAYRAK